ncbi:hypothetical protein QBC37DRAFT_385579 [Rhypophila decipiens]|uniref:Uncharacterized protein n=1 Tax=Rhypophila decipiens TaxID=261697 RepID=A0AAN6YDY9_9PEZI|nr:hypothetical protein QBC37DRAFT_385579 [Rhypophila decipiens]
MFSKLFIIAALGSATIMALAVPAHPLVGGNQALAQRAPLPQAAVEVETAAPQDHDDGEEEESLTTNDIFIHGVPLKHKPESKIEY